MTTKNNTKQTITEAYVYWDNQDPMDTGWAYRYLLDGVEQSGPLDCRDRNANGIAAYQLSKLTDFRTTVRALDPDTGEVCRRIFGLNK